MKSETCPTCRRTLRRTSSQNDRMHAMVRAVAKHMKWHGQILDVEEWKILFTAALHRQKVYPGLEGGFVVAGKPTSLMTKAEMTDLMELIAAFSAENNVPLQEGTA